MNIKVFTLKFNSLLGGFDDAEVRAFIADKEVQEIHNHAFTHQGFPYLTLVVNYRSLENNSENSVPTVKKHHTDDSWRKLISSTDIPFYNTLREWRAAKSKEEGIPTYFICTTNLRVG